MKLERTGGVDLNPDHHTCAYLLAYRSPHSFTETWMHVYMHVHDAYANIPRQTDRWGGAAKRRDLSGFQELFLCWNVLSPGGAPEFQPLLQEILCPVKSHQPL